MWTSGTKNPGACLRIDTKFESRGHAEITGKAAYRLYPHTMLRNARFHRVLRGRDQLEAELAAVQPLEQHALKQHAQKMKMRSMACDR
jgi:hypothetical protein